MKILVVEDEPASRRLVVINLTWGGHEVVEADGGEAGWQAFLREQTRLVITDWMMPEVNGTELIRRIRSAGQAGYTYIILLTAMGTKEHVVVGLESGADDYVTKPYDTQELLARVAIGERILKLEESLLTSRQQMTYLATHDVLTGLLNRRAVQERAEAELNRANRESVPLSLILLDVDHFKSVNDRFGHAVGDQALQLVARLLTQRVRTYDWVGRWGGEEFLMVLPGTPLPEAGVAADRIREALEAAALPLAAGGEVKMTVSLGVACVTPVAGRSPSLEEVVRQTDAALYRAKGLGRNRVCLAE